MRLSSPIFIVKFFASTLLLGVIAALCFILFLPRVYSAEVENGERVVVIRAPNGGIIRALSVRLGEKVRQDTIIAEIVTTDKQPPDAALARAILYKRVETARYESQRGGLKALLLKPDLRARVPLDKEYGRFVAEQRRAFSSFQSKLKRETKTLQENRARLDIQVKGMEREIVDLSRRRALLKQAFANDGGAQLKAELRRNRRSIKRHNQQINGLRRKVRGNAKALLQTTLQVRREEGGGMDQARRELNAFYEQIGLPPNAFDRIGLVGGDGEQRLRRLIARKSGRIVALVSGLKPGDVVVAGQEIAQILPNASESLYRLRLPNNFANYTSSGSEGGLELRRLSCHDFPWRLVLDSDVSIREDTLLLARKVLDAQGLSAPRADARCAVMLGFASELTGGAVLLRLVDGVGGLLQALGQVNRLDNNLDSINDFISLADNLLLFINLEIKNFLNGLDFLYIDNFSWKKIIDVGGELINILNKAKTIIK